uniref:restriction endonuclease subunit S n=1 Tax=Xanthomonas sp. 0924 TaxID=2835534 RepID=UPI003F80C18A
MEMTIGLGSTAADVITQRTLPNGWQNVRLTDVARLESGHTPSKRNPQYWSGGVPWISLHDTEALDAWEIQATNQTITEAGLANSSARLLPKGTVVFSRTATVGKSTVMGRDMATSQDFACYVCGPRVHNFYLALLLRSMRSEWKKLMAGSIHNTVYMPVFKNLAVDLPPHDEQVAIAEAMLDVDKFVESLEQLLTKKRQIKQGAMQELLTGKRRLPGFVCPWEKSKLSCMGVFLKGAGVKRDEALSGDLPCIRYGEIYTTHSDHVRSFTSWISPSVAASATLIRQGDLLFAGSGETKEEIGKCVAFLDEMPAYAGGDILILRPTIVVDSMFLGYLLNVPAVVRQKASKGQGDAVVHINAKALGDIEVKLPEAQEQAAIAEVLYDMDAELATLEARLTKARALKQSMAQALLTGRIRLVEPAA